jgi:hypothetical protein
MREVFFVLPSEEYMPGENITGTLHLRCDDDFDCNRVVLELIGQEVTEVTVGSGDDRRTYKDTHDIVNLEMELSGPQQVYPGEKRFDFSIRLPPILPPSYNGPCGTIRYYLSGKAEVSWSIDPKAMAPISIPMVRPEHPPENRHFHFVSGRNESWVMRVESGSDTLFFGDKYKFRIIVAEGARLRKVKAHLFLVELVAPDGYENKTYKLMNSWEIPDKELPRNAWLDVWMETMRDWPAPFTSNLIRTEYWLHVGLDVPWLPDKVIEIPLKAWMRNPDSDRNGDFEW